MMHINQHESTHPVSQKIKKNTPLSLKNLAFATVMSTATAVGYPSANPAEAKRVSQTNPTAIALSPKSIKQTPNIHQFTNISEEILNRYEQLIPGNSLKNEPKNSTIVREETKSFVEKILSFLGISASKNDSKVALVQKSEMLDTFILARAAKEYLDIHMEEFIGKYPNKQILLGYSPTAKTKNSIVIIPIPIGNGSETKNISVQEAGTTFSVKPIPRKNGYNTEFAITGPRGEIIYQLSLLYLYKKGEFFKQKEKVTILQSQIGAFEDQIKQTQNIVLEKKTTSSTKKLHKNRVKNLNKLDLSQKKLQLKKKLEQTKILLQKEKNILSTLTEYEYVSYIPYAEHFNTPHNQRRGLQYLSESMRATYESNSSKKIGKIPSAVPKLSIEEAIPDTFPMLLNIIERMDYQSYYESDGKTLKNKKDREDLMKKQAETALTTFGMNLDKAFALQKSKVGALGIGQIMPSTYQLFQKHPKYGGWFPEEDFTIAAKDHSTTFRLQIAHFDDQIFQLPKEIRNNWSLLLNDQNTRIGLISLLTAGYNGSMARIIKEVFPLGGANLQSIDQYKAKLSPTAIQKAMEDARDKKIAPLENKLKENIPLTQKKSQKSSKKNGKFRRTLTQNKRAIITSQIASIDATFRESITYVMKTEFVWKYLNQMQEAQ